MLMKNIGYLKIKEREEVDEESAECHTSGFQRKALCNFFLAFKKKKHAKVQTLLICSLAFVAAEGLDRCSSL